MHSVFRTLARGIQDIGDSFSGPRLMNSINFRYVSHCTNKSSLSLKPTLTCDAPISGCLVVPTSRNIGIIANPRQRRLFEILSTVYTFNIKMLEGGKTGSRYSNLALYSGL